MKQLAKSTFALVFLAFGCDFGASSFTVLPPDEGAGGTNADGDSDGSGGDSGGAAARCGNGEKETGEECDDGNANDEDDCTSLCRLPRSGGSGGSLNLPMHCEEGAEDCNCDAATGCFIEQGGTCVSNSGCVSQFCGVAQDNSNLCCAELCESGSVCLADGSGCEAESTCTDDDVRCAEGGSSFQRCVSGQWVTNDSCGNLGCDISLGGCLGSLGESCTDDNQCGEGQCQETPDGESVCCALSCGSCQVCSSDADSCVDPQTVKEGCSCTDDDLSNCDDGLSCTTEVCNEGQCSNELDPGYCVIDGRCLDHNAAEPGNPCRYCDANIRTQGWTNSSNAVSCDDGAWCTGVDTCDGSGQCQHQFPTNNRCNQTGECALSTCDEARDSCFKPSTNTCQTATSVEYRCEPGTCGADAQSRPLTHYCSGSSPDCDGEVVPGSFATLNACSAVQTCSHSGAGAPTCQNSLACAAEWCDAAAGLCWAPRASGRIWSEAIDYCEQLVLGGRSDWRLPTIHELISALRGCVDGAVVSASSPSTCQVPDTTVNTTQNCGSCTTDGGPSSGCYMVPEMAAECAAGNIQDWSSDMGPFGPWMVRFDGAGVSNAPGTSPTYGARCVVSQ